MRAHQNRARLERLRRTLEGRKRLQRPVLLADALSTSRWKRHAGPSRSRARRLRTWRRPACLGWRRCSSPWPGSASCRLGASARGLVIGLAPATLPTTRVAAVSTRIACRGERRSQQAPGLIWWQSSERRGAEGVRRWRGQLTSFFLTAPSMPRSPESLRERLSAARPSASPVKRRSYLFIEALIPLLLRLALASVLRASGPTQARSPGSPPVHNVRADDRGCVAAVSCCIPAGSCGATDKAT